MSGCIMSPPTENTVFMVSINHSLSGAYVWKYIGTNDVNKMQKTYGKNTAGCCQKGRVLLFIWELSWARRRIWSRQWVSEVGGQVFCGDFFRIIIPKDLNQNKPNVTNYSCKCIWPQRNCNTKQLEQSRIIPKTQNIIKTSFEKT